MKDHKSLLAWKHAHDVAHGVLDICRDHWTPHASAVFGQLQWCSLSVQLNIAEGYALRTPRRLFNHLTIAFGSLIETIDLLELLLERGLVPAESGGPVLDAAIRTRRLLLGLLHKYEPSPPHSSPLTPHYLRSSTPTETP